jgi:hypothetical protein
MVLMQSGLRNPDNIITNSEHVCNIDIHFKDNINLPNSHPCVFMILFDMNKPFFWLFLKAKFKIVEMREIMIADAPFLFMMLVKSGLRNPDCKGTFLKILYSAREDNKVGKVIL